MHISSQHGEPTKLSPASVMQQTRVHPASSRSAMGARVHICASKHQRQAARYSKDQQMVQTSQGRQPPI